MVRYRLTLQARDDIRSIWSYIAANNLEAADRMIDRFTDMFRLLAVNHHAGRRQAQYQPALRSFAVDRYVVFYTPTPSGIEIYRVLHGARYFPGTL
jgi:toxin ParE1/3/4